ncbi:hypothetical protein [Hyalangium rubrum]|uniref:Fibronectin type-III domain-containing protein n=1 Tax=Hyalangium rubrum TaxID=3103134 RepID=A0ABU5HGJ2_9BACT|nr:hypothetical protein [Hyalangium sp. s54d21]MDY7232581.1 hypothetical protein [Hyalangium sp. s54d21]
MSERKWPTRTGFRIRLALVVGFLLAMMGTARADWEMREVPGTPDDVEVWPNGLYSVSTTQGAYLYAPGGGTLRSLPGFWAVGTHLSDGGCFAAFRRDDGVESVPTGCAPSADLFATGDAPNLTRVKHTRAGNAFAWGVDTVSGSALLAYGDGGVRQPGPWALLYNEPGLTTDALGVLSLDSGEHALVGIRPGAMGFLWYRGDQLQASYVAPGPYTPASPLAIELIPSGTAAPTALLATTSGLLRGTLDTSAFPFAEVDVPPQFRGTTVASVDVNTDAGTAYGEGFGMALAPQPGGSVVLRAVPGTRPEEFGTTWRVSPRQPPLPAPPREVACRGAEFCVLTLGRMPDAGVPNIAFYRNVHAPVVDAGTDASVPESSVGTIFVSVDDLDGDPVRVTVEPPEMRMNGVHVTSAVREDGVEFTVDAGPLCEGQAVHFELVTADGMASHQRRVGVDLRVRHTLPPETPELTTNRLTVQAGGDAGVIELLPPTNPRCAITDYYWEAQTPSAPAIAPGSMSATFPSPPTLCAENGVSYFYRVYAKDKEGLLSSPAEFGVQVRPWGTPYAPFGAGAGAALNAGQSLTIEPQAEHACVGSTGYPGVDTVWDLPAGALPPSKIQLLTEDGSPVTTTRAVTPRLTVQTEECASAVLPFSVRHVPKDGSGILGPVSAYEVTVNPNWVPLSAGQPVLTETSSTSQGVTGTVTAPWLNCISERGGVKANLRLEREDGSVAQQGTFNVPGPWTFPLGDRCEGARYRVVGQLVGGAGVQGGAGLGEDMPGTLAEDAELTVNVPPVTIPLEPLEAPRLTAVCGEAARGTLQQRLPLGPCATVPLTWEQIDEDGPALTQRVFTGPRIDVETQDTDFGALIGQSVVLRVTANNGLVSRQEHTVPITVEPFVALSRRTERPAGGETNLIGVSVELRNTTACGVREVVHEELLEGADYVSGSARFNGAPVEATFDGTRLKVSGLVLEGGATGQLSYVVRPKLLGSQRFEGQASLRTVPISRAPEAPLSGCGCSGGGSGAAALGLTGLLTVLRRRRKR